MISLLAGPTRIRKPADSWIIGNSKATLAATLMKVAAYLAGVLGHREETGSVVEGLQARRAKGYAPALAIARTYLGLGETGHAISWLETALAERDPFLGSLMVFPGYDSIRDQAQFKRLIGQLKLPT